MFHTVEPLVGTEMIFYALCLFFEFYMYLVVYSIQTITVNINVGTISLCLNRKCLNERIETVLVNISFGNDFLMIVRGNCLLR